MLKSFWAWKRLLLSTGLLLVCQFGLIQPAEAVPAYARQTAMNCNSCHIGTYSVPNFTRTGRIFAMRGYTKPYVRERLRAEGDTGNDNKNSQYGGDYLALNWTDYFSARLISGVVEGGKDSAGNSKDTRSSPLSRMALFYTGAVTDWLGLWTEIGYLGNNQLHSVSEGSAGEGSGVNFFAYDEYRIATSFDFGKNSFYGFSMGNEHPNTVGQFNFPVAMPDLWFNGQGGSGRSLNIANISAQMFYDDRWWLQLAGVSGGDNTNWSKGNNWYVNVARNFIRTQRNDIWLVAEYYGGNDFPSIMTPVKTSFLCETTCPDGVVDDNFSIRNVPGFTRAPITNAPVEEVDDFSSYKVSLQNAVADHGVHTWYATVTLMGMQQDYESGAKVETSMAGATLRYFYKRTYGFDVYFRDQLKYEYTTPGGLKRDTYSKADYGVTALWYPAMNVDLWLRWSPQIDNIVFKDERNLYTDKASSYSLGMEYNF